MSKIQTIKPNYQPAVQARLKKQNGPAFSGGETVKTEVLTHVEKELTKTLGSGGKFFKWLGDGNL